MTPARRNNMPIFGRNIFRFSEFDALPPAVRSVINFAPIQLGTRRAVVNLAAGASVGQTCAAELRVARRAAFEMLLQSYGPDHPRLERLAGDEC